MKTGANIIQIINIGMDSKYNNSVNRVLKDNLIGGHKALTSFGLKGNASRKNTGHTDTRRMTL